VGERLVAEQAAEPLPAQGRPAVQGRRLQRAAPGDEHLADSALPFAADGSLELPSGRRAAHVLATDNGLR
jgi:hypothetical protein